MLANLYKTLQIKGQGSFRHISSEEFDPTQCQQIFTSSLTTTLPGPQGPLTDPAPHHPAHTPPNPSEKKRKRPILNRKQLASYVYCFVFASISRQLCRIKTLPATHPAGLMINSRKKAVKSDHF